MERAGACRPTGHGTWPCSGPSPRCFATDAPHERMIAVMLHIGVDGVVSGYPDRMTDAAAAAARPDAPELLDE